MKLREIIGLLREDAFWIYMDNYDVRYGEYIESSEKSDWVELKDYFDYEVLGIQREEYSMAIILKSK